jgi:hypothetical protein
MEDGELKMEDGVFAILHFPFSIFVYLDEKPLEPDLAAVVAAWPSLSAPLKAAIVAIANTATNKAGQ